MLQTFQFEFKLKIWSR